MDHTDAGGTTYTYTQLLNGTGNNRVGLAKSFSVMAGDEVSGSAWVKYMNLSGTSNTNVLLASLANAFGGVSGGGGESGKIYTGLNSFAGTVPLGDHPGDDEGAPKAFVTILFFDKNYNFLDAAWDQVDTDGAQTSGSVKQPPHDLLSVTGKAPENGYAFVFLSNEHSTLVDVYFDDATFSHTPGPIVSSSDYYPFGLTFNSYSRENSVPNQYQYNGKELQDELGLNLLDYGARFYDPSISRWQVIDPSSDQANQEKESPYCYVGNNPVIRVDPDGRIWDVILDVAFLAYDAGEIAYQYATTGKVEPVSVAALSADAAATFIPFVTGAGLAVRAGKEGGEQVAKHLAKEGVEQGVKKMDQAALARGRQNEAKTLAQEGLDKNTKTMTATDPKTGKQVNTIPDAVKKDGGTVDVKDKKVVSDSPQLRAQTEVSSQSGQKGTVITGTNTKVSKTVQERMTVIRRDNIGPQQ